MTKANEDMLERAAKLTEFMLDKAKEIDSALEGFFEEAKAMSPGERQVAENFVCGAVVARVLQQQPLCIGSPQVAQILSAAIILLTKALDKYPDVDPGLLIIEDDAIEQIINVRNESKSTSSTPATTEQELLIDYLESLTPEELEQYLKDKPKA